MRRVRKVKMAQKQKKYEKEYKVQAVKLAKEIGAGKAAKELGDTGGHAVRVTEGGTGRSSGGGTWVPPTRQRNEPCGGIGGAAQAEQGVGARDSAAEGRK